MADILCWTKEAWSDYLYWQDQDRKALRRINQLIIDTRRSPFKGTGKQEALTASLSGFWSCRIDESDRLVYVVDKGQLTIIACRYHYEK